MRFLTCLALLLSGCAAIPFTGNREPAAVLYPQLGRVEGEAWLQPRYAREPYPVRGPILLEPGDRVGTGPAGRVEILLPRSTVRLYGDTQVRVPFVFAERVAESREVEVEKGEALVRTAVEGPFTVRTFGLTVDATVPSTVLVGSRDGVHQAVCYRGEAEAKNVRVRGQTVVRLGPGFHLSLDDGATLAYLREGKFPDEWALWERRGHTTAGIVPLPAAPAAVEGETSPQPAAAEIPAQPSAQPPAEPVPAPAQ